MKRVVIFAGTGFIGTALARYFSKNNEVVVVGRTRSIDRFRKQEHELIRDNGIKTLLWDGLNLEKDWTSALENAGMVINLAGKSVNCRYTAANRKAVLESRTITTSLIGRAIQACKQPPELWINAGSSTIYTNSYQKANDETNGLISDWKNDNMPFSLLDRLRFFCKKSVRMFVNEKQTENHLNLNKDFSVAVCKAWEKSFFECPTPQTRKVALRIAIVLGRGGVMQPYRMLSLLGLGGQQGTGNQKFSWVHLEDVCRACEFINNRKELTGIFNLASPDVVTNAAFCNNIKKLMSKRVALPATAFMLEIGAMLLGTETELILKSRWVTPRRLLEAGFKFEYPELNGALNNILTNWNHPVLNNHSL